MWMLLTAAPLAQSQLGYPIFVRAERGRCTFQILDMIMSRGSDVRGWMSGLDYKGRQIDIVWFEESDKACVAKAEAFARTGGFSRVMVRNGKGLNYPSGLPPE